MAYATISIKDARSNLAELVERVSTGGETVALTKFGKLKALMVPLSFLNKGKKPIDRTAVLRSTFGIWKGRKDMADASRWVKRTRAKNSSRYGKIFG